MRIFRPASGDAEASTMLASDCFEDGLRAGLEEEARDVFAESGGLLGRRGGTLADILRAVDGADAGFEDEFAALGAGPGAEGNGSEEHTSELQSRQYLVCRLLLEKKKKNTAYL